MREVINIQCFTARSTKCRIFTNYNTIRTVDWTRLVFSDHHGVFHACNHVLDLFVREEGQVRRFLARGRVASAELSELVQPPAVQRTVLCVSVRIGLPN